MEGIQILLEACEEFFLWFGTNIRAAHRCWGPLLGRGRLLGGRQRQSKRLMASKNHTKDTDKEIDSIDFRNKREYSGNCLSMQRY